MGSPRDKLATSTNNKSKSNSGKEITDNVGQSPAHNRQANSAIDKLDTGLQKIIHAEHFDPFSILGKHTVGSTDNVHVFIPRAQEVYLPSIDAPMQRIPETDIFKWQGEIGQLTSPYQVK